LINQTLSTWIAMELQEKWKMELHSKICFVKIQMQNKLLFLEIQELQLFSFFICIKEIALFQTG
jgi:hypothetical protein